MMRVRHRLDLGNDFVICIEQLQLLHKRLVEPPCACFGLINIAFDNVGVDDASVIELVRPGLAHDWGYLACR